MPSFPANPPRPLPVSRRRVVFLAFDGVLAVDIAGPSDAFSIANRLAPAPLYELRHVSVAGGAVPTASGLVLATERADGVVCASFDTFVVPGGPFIADAIADAALVDLVQRASRQVRRTCSVCSGAFLLGAAGLLDGRRAVTHWAMADAFQARFPKVRLELDPIYLEDGPIWSSAGVTAGIDLALALIRRDAGAALAAAVAKQMVVFLQRPGGQAQFSAALLAQTGQARRDDPLFAIGAFIAANLAGDLSVAALAREAGMAPRSFARRLANRPDKLTPAKLVEAVRVEAACRALFDSKHPVKDIAARCGFGDEERMRRAFLRRLGVAPSDYRARFSTDASARRAVVA